MIIAEYIMLMHRRVSVGQGANGREIAYKIISSNLPGLAVVNESMEVIGIVTEFDLLGNLREGRDLDDIIAEKIMSKEPFTAGLENSAEELIEIMLENNFTMIPVTKDNKLVGIVDRASLIETYTEPAMSRYVK